MARPVLWQPGPNASAETAMGRFAAECSRRTGRDLTSYDELWKWSVTDIDGFWRSIFDAFEIEFDGDPTVARTGDEMFSTRWFPDVSLNYAEQALSTIEGRDNAAPAVISESQRWGTRTLSLTELRREVAKFQSGLRALGVGRGDAIGAYLPNIAETVVALLACAGMGVTWASCAPEFGVHAVTDRLGQLEPKVLLAVEGYSYGDKQIDRRRDLAEIRSALSSVEHTVVLPDADGAVRTEGVIHWADLMDGAVADQLVIERVPFDHPLYVLFSSGTTGLPKPIVHGHGGILVEHLKTLGLQCDVGPGDRFFWFSTTGWMMWNLLVSALGVGATVICFDGDPVRPDPSTLWSFAERHSVTYFGTSASYLMAERTRGVEPCEEHDLSAVRTIGSTGSPLPSAGFEWVADNFGPEVQLASISGGTDVCSAFVGAAPLVPVWSGEISCRYLGAKVEAFDPEGESVVDEQGELVITAPLPSMPVAFLGDPDRTRLHSAYFERIPGVWAHGDWITITSRGSCVISGRSDATLNRGGVRLGTSEFYAVVDAVDGVADSLVVHLEDPDGGPGRLLLFFVPAESVDGAGSLVERIRSALRSQLSPRHVPDEVHAIRTVPRTLSGKKVEVPVKSILRGAEPAEVVSLDSLVDPTALEQFRPYAVSVRTD